MVPMRDKDQEVSKKAANSPNVIIMSIINDVLFVSSQDAAKVPFKACRDEVSDVRASLYGQTSLSSGIKRNNSTLT